MIPLPTQIDGNRVSLRKPRMSDAPFLQEQVSRPEVVLWTVQIPHPYPDGGARRFLQASWRRWTNGTGYVFTIVSREAEDVIGLISLSNVSEKHGCAELGYWSGPDHWGKGIMTEAVRLALTFAFEHLQLHRVYASTFGGNEASRRVLEKNGLKLEGTMREAVVRRGKRQDFLNFGILRPEYQDGNPRRD